MSELVDAYLAEKKGLGFKENTVTRWRMCLGRFERELDPRRILDATGDDVAAYLAGVRALSTKHNYRSDIKGFFGWAIAHKLTDDNPALGVTLPRCPRPRAKPIRSDDLLVAWQTADTQLRAILALEALAGLRASEVAQLRRADLRDDLARPVILVPAGIKGGKGRPVPLHPLVLECVAHLPKRGPLFVDAHGQALTGRRVSGLVGAHLRRCGIEATGHQLRHWFGTMAAAQTNGNLVKVGAWMGHRNLETTQGYVLGEADDVNGDVPALTFGRRAVRATPPRAPGGAGQRRIPRRRSRR